VVDVPNEYSGKVIDMVTQRKGELHVMETKGDMQHLEFEIPSRGLIDCVQICLPTQPEKQ
jgi:GTP-binding protein